MSLRPVSPKSVAFYTSGEFGFTPRTDRPLVLLLFGPREDRSTVLPRRFPVYM